MISHSRPTLSEADIQAVETALRSGQLSQGPRGAALEAELNLRYPNRTAVAVSSGTAALYIALCLLELPAKAEVIIPAYACNALFCAVSHAGLQPVCADVDPCTAGLNAATVQAKISDRTAAVIVPHTFGIRAPIEEIRALGFPVIEDCAQCLGGRNSDGSLLGSNGDLAILSFFATKPIAGGEGGAVLLPDHLAARARQLRDCDETDPDPRAFNFKLSDIHAALITSTLSQLDAFRIARHQLANRFDQTFGPAALHQKLENSTTPQALCFRYLIQTGAPADALLKPFEDAGICARRPIWKPLHLATGDRCPVTEQLARTLVSVPLYPALIEPEIEQILLTGQKIIGANARYESF